MPITRHAANQSGSIAICRVKQRSRLAVSRKLRSQLVSANVKSVIRPVTGFQLQVQVFQIYFFLLLLHLIFRLFLFCLSTTISRDSKLSSIAWVKPLEIELCDAQQNRRLASPRDQPVSYHPLWTTYQMLFFETTNPISVTLKNLLSI